MKCCIVREENPGDLTVPEGVEYIESGAWNSCNKLTTITFSKTLYSFNNYDFTEMASLTAINVPAENEHYVSKDGILYGKDYDDNDKEYLYHLYCYPPAKSGAYNIPSTVVEISGSTFRNAKKMTSLSIPKSVYYLMDWENLNTMDSLTSVAIAQDSELDYCTVNGIIYNKDKTEICYVPNAKSGTVTILQTVERIYSAFNNCTKLTKVVIPASVYEISNDAFDTCTALTEFSVAQGNETFKSVNGALLYSNYYDHEWIICVPKAVTEFTIPETILNHDYIRNEAFYNCNALTTLNFGENFDFDIWWSWYGRFDCCPALKTMNVDENNANFKSIDGVVYNTDAVVFVPPAYEGVLNVPKFATYFYDGAFINCSKITAINFSRSCTNEINFDTLNNTTSLESVTMPNNKNYTIENGAVYNSDKTELYHVFKGISGEFVVPSSVTYIRENAFKNCSKLTKVVIPDSITELNIEFNGCTDLKVLEVPTSVNYMYDYQFENMADDFTIEGYAGSYAERYANYHNYNFRRLADEITLNKTTVSTAVGRTLKLVPTIKTDKTFDKTVTFASENPKVAKVAADGTVTALAAGTVKITATTVNGKTASCLVTVNPALSNISEISSDNILVNGTSTVTVKAQDGTGSYKYAVDYRLSGAANWTSLLAKGSTSTANFTTATAGTYEIKTTVTDKDGFTSEKIFTVKVNAKIANTSTVSAAKTTLGNAVTVNGKSTGGLGGTTYKYEYKLSSASAWTTISNYSTADSTVFKPTDAGTYSIRVTAKDIGGNTASKTLSVTVTDVLENTTTISAEKIIVGGKVNVTVSATGGMSDYTYACYKKAAGASSWTTVSGFGNTTSFEISFDKADNYILCTKVKDQNGTVSKEYVSVSVCNALKNISSVDKNAIVLGDTVTVNADAADGMGGYTYEISYKKTSDSKWTVKQAYAENSTVSIKPASAADYTISVKAKDESGTVKEKKFTVAVNKVLANNSTVAADTVTLNEFVVINGQSTGGSGEKTYKYEYKLSSSDEWTVLSDFSNNASFLFKPSETGTYDIRVTVKDAKGTSSEKLLSVNVADILTNTSTLSAGTIVLGKSVTVTGSAAGGKGDYQYAYMYKKFSQKNWTQIADYSTNNSVQITPKGYGDYQVCVKVKDSNGTVATEYLNLIVNDKLKNNSTISDENIVLGKSVTVTAAAADGMGGYTYAVLYKQASSSKWTNKQDFSSNATVSIKPAKAVAYDICVKVKDKSGTIVKKFFTVNVKAPLENTSVISSETLKLGETLTVNASAAGGEGKYTYAVLYKQTSSSKWTNTQDFTENTTVSIKPSKAAAYEVCVKVKDQTGTIVKKYFNVTVS